MAADVITSLAGSLDAELDEARETLKGVDNSIKKLFGKEATELNSFSRNRRGPLRLSSGGGGGGGNEEYRTVGSRSWRGRDRESDDFTDEPSSKRRRSEYGQPMRTGPLILGPRVRPRDDEMFDDMQEGYGPSNFSNRKRHIMGDDDGQPHRLQSRVVTFGKDKSRDEVIAEQRVDESRDRNKRMFGALLGTLQRFRQEETKLRPQETRRAQIEAKLDEASKKEREELRKEKQDLIRDRRIKLSEIRRLEMKRTRVGELEAWEAKMKNLTNFIRTESKPHIFFAPKVMTPILECRLEQSKQIVSEMIAEKRKCVLEDLEDYERRSKRFWELERDRSSQPQRRRMNDHMYDDDLEDELREIMRTEKNAKFSTEEAMDEVEDFTITVFHGTETVTVTSNKSNGEPVDMSDSVSHSNENSPAEPSPNEPKAKSPSPAVAMEVEQPTETEKDLDAKDENDDEDSSNSNEQQEDEDDQEDDDDDGEGEGEGDNDD